MTLDEIAALAARFFDAIEVGDVAAVADCYADEVAIWHNTDRQIETKADNVKTLSGFIRHIPTRRYEDRRLTVFPGGFVQQHLLVGVRPDGKRVELPACLVCAVAGGKITRLDEYFDSEQVAAWAR
ncbi:nuclear transport factor 2 family protein [Phenylobacterium aquaticum]|uniref:nuclear transport factor 2 family protein n=1 Tax=Phenylobacterium aquaticum TaxID=1763816 RepID=UPI0026EF0F41|nr:nuclear transport factor 2 family protein [Phenylobacterium aquaticum]